ncbi:hypothetical protein RV11_GL000021 [Enterococcus phoeniculicola]|nr:hypothetical protein RV11_GL000021 [Enterococcus phoeniculicola]
MQVDFISKRIVVIPAFQKAKESKEAFFILQIDSFCLI